MSPPHLLKIATSEPAPKFDVQKVRLDFPLLTQTRQGKPLVYLDNAATSQKPEIVIETIQQFYESENANIHRGVYKLSEEATDKYEATRKKIQNFLHAKEHHEIIFVRGTTEAINLVAQSYGRAHLKSGDEVLITGMEHHSNIVPWQILGDQLGTKLKVVPINDKGEINLNDLEKLITPRTKLLSVTHTSNALGSINPLEEIIHIAHSKGTKVLVDGAQAIPHFSINVQNLDCDFYAFSGHKLFGPTGIGVLYGKAELLDSMPPYQGGGDMIRHVTFEKTEYAPLPHKFEAGTPHISGVIGLGAAIDYLNELDRKAAQQHETDLLLYTTKLLKQIPQIKIIGEAFCKTSLVSFVCQGIHPHDMGTILDQDNIAVRAGHHCAQPVMDFFGIPATVRASFAFYNTKEEIDKFVEGIEKAVELFK